MARYDKVSPYGGSFRAYLAADWAAADIGKLYGVGLDTNGLVVKGVGTTGIIGVLCLTRDDFFDYDEPVDVMTKGEIIEFGPTTGTPGVDFGDAGSAYYADDEVGTAGEITTTSAAGKVFVGFTVEADRLIVNVGARAIQAS